jgi:hypothetical protein
MPSYFSSVPWTRPSVAVNLRRHRNLIAWAKERGLFVRVDRATAWGNPFVIGRDGDRATVIARYRDHHLPSRPDLLARLGELRGKALGCWCSPLACHANVLAAAAATLVERTTVGKSAADSRTARRP